MATNMPEASALPALAFIAAMSLETNFKAGDTFLITPFDG